MVLVGDVGDRTQVQPRARPTPSPTPAPAPGWVLDRTLLVCWLSPIGFKWNPVGGGLGLKPGSGKASAISLQARDRGSREFLPPGATGPAGIWSVAGLGGRCALDFARMGVTLPCALDLARMGSPYQPLASVVCPRSRDPSDGLGAQVTAAALRRGPRQGLGVGEGRQGPLQAGAVRTPAPHRPWGVVKWGRFPSGARRSAGARWGAQECSFQGPFWFPRQPHPVPGSQAEPPAQLHECDLDTDPLGDAGEPPRGASGSGGSRGHHTLAFRT